MTRIANYWKKPLFDDFLEHGYTGFYNHCLVITIFIFDIKSQTAINFFTSVTFFDAPTEGEILKERKSKLAYGTNQYSVYTVAYYESVSNIQNNYDNLKKYNTWKYNGNNLVLNELIEEEVRFIPARRIMKDDLFVTNILPVRSNVGNYIFEFTDYDKKHLNEFYENIPDELFPLFISEIITHTGFDFSHVLERRGNVIFQFPITLFDYELIANCDIHLKWNSNLPNSIPTLLNFFDEKDKSIEKLYTAILDSDTIKMGGTPITTKVILRRQSDNLIIGLLKNCKFNAGSSKHMVYIPMNRRFPDGSIRDSSISYEKSPKKLGISDLIDARNYDLSREVLEQTLAFKQYTVHSTQEEIYHDFQILISEYSTYGVYMWDPYLTADVIENILFYAKSLCPVRAITSNKLYSKIPEEDLEKIRIAKEKNQKIVFKDEWDRQTINQLSALGSPKFWRFEFRIQRMGKGTPFHDRFLIFPGKRGDRPRAWSYGKSISDTSMQHFILQEVAYPVRILEAFDSLWSQLNTPETILYRNFSIKSTLKTKP